MSTTFSSLRIPSFRAFIIGSFISFSGTWMMSIAMPWLTLSLTGSAVKGALTSMLQTLPVLLFTLFYGAILDRVNKKSAMRINQVLLTAITGTLAWLTLTDRITYPLILVLAFLLGIVNAMDMPARQAIMAEIVPPDQLTNAIALNSGGFNLSRIFGPSIAGAILAWTSPGVCFSIAAAAYLLFFFLLNFVQLEQIIIRSANKPILESIREGYDYIRRTPILRTLLSLLSLFGILALNFNVTMPIFARQEMGYNETQFGLMMSGIGLGAFLATLMIARNSNPLARIRNLLLAPFITAVALLLLSQARSFPLILALTVLCGFGMIMFAPNANATVQSNSRPEMHGRVMSFYTFLFIGSTPIGNMLVGYLGDNFGARAMFYVPGLLLILMFGLVYRMERVALYTDRTLAPKPTANSVTEL
ncbi:MAG TPA: MFS transporter [Bellilinea sp.]|nr:MFS transporter [Bellilinea sp.]